MPFGIRLFLTPQASIIPYLFTMNTNVELHIHVRLNWDWFKGDGKGYLRWYPSIKKRRKLEVLMEKDSKKLFLLEK
jgi:hypothetical protein